MKMRGLMGGRRRTGTTLVEVLIAVAILAVVLLMFLSIMYSANTTSANSKESTIAVYVLQSYLEDTFSPNYTNFWESRFGSAAGNIPGGPTLLDNQNGQLFPNIMADGAISASISTINALLPAIQAGTQTPAQTASWAAIVNLFKNHYLALNPSNRLKGETIRLYLLPTSDIYIGGGWNSSLSALSHSYVEYMVEITWTDASGKPRHESITTRRSQ